MSPDEWFVALREQLATSEWRSEATQLAIRRLFETYTGPLAKTLHSKAGELPDDLRHRLRAYVLSWPAFMNARKKRDVAALVTALSADRPLRFVVEHKGPLSDAELEDLGSTALYQCLHAAGSIENAAFRTVASLRQKIGADVDPHVECWRYSEGGTLKYVLWTLYRRSGTFFKPRDRAPLLSVVSGEWPSNRAPLAVALEEASPFLQLTSFRL